jgi:hypothetical protein
MYGHGAPSEDDDKDETFRRKPRSKRAQAIIEEARRALQYIEDRQARERTEVSAPLLSGGASFDASHGVARSPLPLPPKSFASSLRSPSLTSLTKAEAPVHLNSGRYGTSPALL